jgi:hypothetical protein
MKIPLGNAEKGVGGTVLMLVADKGVLFHIGRAGRTKKEFAVESKRQDGLAGDSAGQEWSFAKDCALTRGRSRQLWSYHTTGCWYA